MERTRGIWLPRDRYRIRNNFSEVFDGLAALFSNIVPEEVIRESKVETSGPFSEN